MVTDVSPVMRPARLVQGSLASSANRVLVTNSKKIIGVCLAMVAALLAQDPIV